MKIHIDVRNVYGTTKYYPVCLVGRTFAKIAQTKTLTPETCELIKSLGYSFVPANSDLLFKEVGGVVE